MVEVEGGVRVRGEGLSRGSKSFLTNLFSQSVRYPNDINTFQNESNVAAYAARVML